MEPGLRRAAGVTTSSLVRQLSAWTGATSASPAAQDRAAQDRATPSRPAAAEPSLAERLGGWLDWTDAIALAGVLAPLNAAEQRLSAPEAAALLRQALAEREHVQAGLLREIDGGAAYHQSYAAMQRLMAERIGALRSRLRALLQRASPRLARLAALDAAMEDLLRLRERHLLSHVPALAQAHIAPEGAEPGDAGRAQQTLLRAELELRLQPVDGLIEALEQAAPQREPQA